MRDPDSSILFIGAIDMMWSLKLKKGSSPKTEMFLWMHPRLMMIVFDFLSYLHDNGVSWAEITSMFRLGDKGVHGDYRGLDIGTDNIPYKLGQKAADYINKKYPYDPKRPKLDTCFFHAVPSNDDSGYHYHFQTMP